MLWPSWLAHDGWLALPMTTVLFVHGIGVRHGDHQIALAGIRTALASRPDVRLATCDWGDRIGARLSDPVADVRAILDGDADPLVDVWALLDADPLLELKALASAGSSRRPADPYDDPAQVLTRAVRQLPGDPEVLAALGSVGLAEVLPGAVDAVLGATATLAALERAAELEIELRAILARAVIATAMTRAGAGTEPLPLDGRTVSGLTDLVLDRLGGAALAPGRLSLWALGKVANRVADRRDSWLTQTVRFAGDVAQYLVRGEELRTLLAAAITAVTEDGDGPVVLVGHSLGGIACVDHLSLAGPVGVHSVVTVGTQVSYLYGVDCLPGWRAGSLPPHRLPRWLNVHDPRDLLSFPCEGAFAGWATDRLVDGQAAFPRAHSAYFTNKQFHAALIEALP